MSQDREVSTPLSDITVEMFTDPERKKVNQTAIPATDTLGRFNPAKFGITNVKIDDLRFTHTGMQIQSELSYEQWTALLPHIHSINTAYQWILGDWLVYGQERDWDKTYAQLAEDTGINPDTLKDYAYVCRHVLPSERSDALGIQHHRYVVGLEPHQQRELLALAVKYKLSSRDFEMAVDLLKQGQKSEQVIELMQSVTKKKQSPVEKAQTAQVRARHMVIKKASVKKNRDEWIEYAKQEAEAWQKLVGELEKK